MSYGKYPDDQSPDRSTNFGRGARRASTAMSERYLCADEAGLAEAVRYFGPPRGGSDVATLPPTSPPTGASDGARRPRAGGAPSGAARATGSSESAPLHSELR